MAASLVIQPYQSRPDTSKIFKRFTVFLTSGNIFQNIPYPFSQYVDEEMNQTQPGDSLDMKSNVVTVLNIPLRERNNTFDMNDKLDNIRVQLNVYVVQLEVFQFFLFFCMSFTSSVFLVE